LSAKLVVISGVRKGLVLSVGAATITIGRAPGQTLRFGPDEDLVSSRHATVVEQGGRYVLRDCGSRNGTIVDGQRVVERELHGGEIVEFGEGGPQVEFVVASEAPPPPTRAAPLRETVSTLYRAAIDQVRRQRGATARPPTSAVMRAFVRLVYLRSSRRTRVATVLAAIATVSAVAVVHLRGVAERRAAERRSAMGLAALDSALRAERALRMAGDSELAALRQEQRRQVEVIQQQLGFAEAITQEYSRSVALVVFSIRFLDPSSGQAVRQRLDDHGRPAWILIGQDSAPAIELGGSGPFIEVFGSGTGFLVEPRGSLLTNRHVASPTTGDARLERIAFGLSRQVGVPVVARRGRMLAYFPPGDLSCPLTLGRLSDQADVALLLCHDSALPPPLPLGSPSGMLRPGAEVALLGYPEAPLLLLARASETERTEVMHALSGHENDLLALFDELARRRLIQPFLTLGIVSDTTAREVAYTGGTTHGSSGGPVLDASRRVVAINYAALVPDPRDPFRSFRGVPVRFAWALLPVPTPSNNK